MVKQTQTTEPDPPGKPLESAWTQALQYRLADCMDGHKNSTIAAASGVSSESVRRYRNGSSPPIEFVCAVARLTGTSLTWLLTGEGPRLSSELTGWYLSRSTLTELTGELGRRIHALQSRMQLVQEAIPGSIDERPDDPVQRPSSLNGAHGRLESTGKDTEAHNS